MSFQPMNSRPFLALTDKNKSEILSSLKESKIILQKRLKLIIKKHCMKTSEKGFFSNFVWSEAIYGFLGKNRIKTSKYLNSEIF